MVIWGWLVEWWLCFFYFRMLVNRIFDFLVEDFFVVCILFIIFFVCECMLGDFMGKILMVVWCVVVRFIG